MWFTPRSAVGWACAAALIVLGVLALVVPLVLYDGQAHSDGASARGLHVSGNQILDKAGRRVLLQGVNRSGTEYACVQGWGIFDGPSDARSVAAMRRWHVNVVRIPLN